MKISRDWRVVSNNLNVTLEKRHVFKSGKRKGEEEWEPRLFYSTVKNALEGFVNLQIKATGLADLETVVAKIDELKLMIDNLEL